MNLIGRTLLANFGHALSIYPLRNVKFDDVAGLIVVETAYIDAKFKSCLHLAHIFLEVFEAGDIPFVNQLPITNNAGFGVAAGLAGAHVAAGNLAHVADSENLADFGPAGDDIGINWIEQPFERFIYIFDEFVNDVGGVEIGRASCRDRV